MPFFIVGAPRSGTTMLRLMLNNHPNLAVPFESGFIPHFYRTRAEYGDLSVRANAERMLSAIAENPFTKKGRLVLDGDAILSHPISGYADLVYAIFAEYARSKGKQRWGDKTPAYVNYLDMLWELFPGCHIVHLVRDGRDIVLSLRGLDWGTKDIVKAAQDWQRMTSLGRRTGNALGEHYLEVRYEDLVLHTEATLLRICELLREPYTADMLAFHLSAEAELPRDSLRWHTSSVKPPDAAKLFMWKQQMSPADRRIFEEIAGGALEMFGYEKENLPVTWRSRLRKLYRDAKNQLR
jgi:hypothetical protein